MDIIKKVVRKTALWSIFAAAGNIATISLHSQPACSSPPLLSNSAGVLLHFPPGSTVNVYIAPTFAPQEQAAIKAAATAWKTAGAFANVTFTTTDPGAGKNNIRVSEGATTSGKLAQTAYYLAPNTAVLAGGDITFDRTKTNFDNTKAYIPGIISGGDAFLIVVFEHEFGHILGADDFRDSNGTPIDSPYASVMGIYRGTNNHGFPPTSTTLATPPGNASPITQCDSSTIIQAQNSPYPIVGTGDDGCAGCLLYELPPDPGNGGFSLEYQYTFVVVSRIIW